MKTPCPLLPSQRAGAAPRPPAGKLAAAALEGSARQPTALGDIRTTMIIAAALIEGVTLFAIVVCVLLAIKAG